MNSPRYCPNCKTANPTHFTFCSNCGAPLTTRAVSPSPSPRYAPPAARLPTMARQKSNARPWAGCVLILVAVLAILCLAAWFTIPVVADLLPTGGMIAYMQKDQQALAINVVTPDGAPLMEIPVDGENVRYPIDSRDPQRQLETPFSPSGRYLVYTVSKKNRATLMSFDTQTHMARALIEADDLSATLAAESDKVLYWMRRSGSTSAGWIDLAGNLPRELPSSAIVGAADISPDGRQIVYSGIESGQRAIYLLDVGGSTRILASRIAEGAGRFLPDGRTLLLIQRNRGDPYEIYLSSDVTDRQVPDFSIIQLNHTNWSRDGARFVFGARPSGVQSLFLQTRGGTERTELAINFTGVTTTFSPDGRWIAIRLWGAERSDCYLASSDGKTLHRVADNVLQVSTLVVSPNSQWFAIGAKTDAGTNLYLVNPNSGARQFVMEETEDGGRVAFSPNSKRIVYDAKEGGRWLVHARHISGEEIFRVEGLMPAWSR